MTEPTATFTTEGHTPVLIEDWLPIRELGIESTRERSGMGIRSRSPLAFLHVWWARAPLVAASGVALAALLPTWSDGLLDEVDGLQEAFHRMRGNRSDLARREGMDSSDWYREWLLWIIGIRGDAIGAESRRLAGASNADAFPWRAAFKSEPSDLDLVVLHRLLVHRWGKMPSVLDPTAGGGSIPFVTSRFGIPTHANDLNAIAVSTLDVTLRIAATRGDELTGLVKDWGSELADRCRRRLEPYFEVEDPDESVTAYLFANTVACPRTGGPVPLAPNWWLDKSSSRIAARPKPVHGKGGEPLRIEFELVDPKSDEEFDPSTGSVSRGVGISPWDGLTVDGGYIKAEAEAGRMWPTLYAVYARKPGSGRSSRKYFRAPTDQDLACLSKAESDLMERSILEPETLPTEAIPNGSKTSELHRYGMHTWLELATPRQRITHGVFIEEWRRLLDEARVALGIELAADLFTVLALMQGKALNFNSRLSGWQPSQLAVKNVFDRHDFAFKWTHGEFDGARALYPWCVSQISEAYGAIAGLLGRSNDDTLLNAGVEHGFPIPAVASVRHGSAASLDLHDASIECVNIDPPYYDNVQYAELADFFYVWEKRTLGVLHPERFTDELTNKDDEAVANDSRFADAGKRRKELATFDYQQKMQAIFSESHRVLVEDGVMVVWFTHKRAEAWDTLATAMMEAGFTIEASWPVSTQSSTSLHHSAKNSAKSTIMLVCRKRQHVDQDETFFEDIEVELREAARTAVEKFEREVGVGGVDLQLATYGPTLSVISRNWPVLSSEPDETGRSRRLRPEEALDVARQEVARLRMQRLVGKDATFDPATDFWLMCWETFQAREFPYDEARKLALGVGHDVDEAIKAGLLKKKSGNVELVDPTTRGRALRRLVDDSGRFEQLVDALHFMLVTYRDDRLAAARTWLSDSGYGGEQRFLDVVQAAVNAVPRVRTKKGLSLEEAALLEDAVVALFGDEISLPVEAEEKVEAEQMTLGS